MKIKIINYDDRVINYSLSQYLELQLQGDRRGELETLQETVSNLIKINAQLIDLLTANNLIDKTQLENILGRPFDAYKMEIIY